MFRVSLSGTSIVANNWDAGVNENDYRGVGLEIVRAFNNGRTVKAGRGYRVEFDLTKTQAQQLVKDLNDLVTIYAGNYHSDPEISAFSYALKKDAVRIQNQIGGTK